MNSLNVMRDWAAASSSSARSSGETRTLRTEVAVDCSFMRMTIAYRLEISIRAGRDGGFATAMSEEKPRTIRERIFAWDDWLATLEFLVDLLGWLNVFK
ncbi:hypothetical protein [Methylosinus sp. PW1]|uniref:hypothetical protein n=1 Tax=Methylosinus sp. PW1 TaxID=107636 RepID=UPI0018DCF087|nr:hypothetical protein [Methylosinus sp. PW1]